MNAPTPATQTTLADWLSARLDEDEAAARAAMEYVKIERWAVADIDFEGICILDATDRDDRKMARKNETFTAAHIARHDPARVLADVAAHRRLIELWRSAAEHAERHSDTPILGLTAGAYEAAVRNLAMIWVNHPDFREEWRAY